MASLTLPSELVSVDWLNQSIEHPDLIVLDASFFMPGVERDGRLEWLDIRIPGAVFFDRRALFASTGVVEGCKNLPKAVIVSTDQPARAIGLLCVGPRKADEITTALGRFCTPRRVPRGRVWL